MHQGSIQKIVQIQRAFVGSSVPNIVDGERIFLKDDMFYKKTGYGKMKPRWVFLFSDCLLYGKVVEPEKFPENSVNITPYSS